MVQLPYQYHHWIINPEIGKTLSELLNIQKLEQVRNTKSGMGVSNEELLKNCFKVVTLEFLQF